MQPNQAATELTEDQVLAFLVNTLNKDIWDVLVGHRADEDSVTHLCDVSEESPTATGTVQISGSQSANYSNFVYAGS